MTAARAGSAVAGFVAHLLLFGLAGPPIGAAFFLAAAGLWAAAGQGVDGTAVFAVLLGAVLWLTTLPFAYVLGWAPALLAGAMTALLPPLRRPVFSIFSAACGVAASAAMIGFSFGRPPGDPGDAATTFAYLAAGGGAAAVCGWMIHGLRRRSR